MSEIYITGFYRNERVAEQLVREATWILTNYARAYREGNLSLINKWSEKWDNWGKAHPAEREQIETQIISQSITQEGGD